ncbi:MAG: cysteine desulfurase NifS [Clostridia bacterium]|nr:cysteine desulfurase NifS [Clostridia bacterium]
MEKLRYFDHAATTATKEEVVKEMLPYFTLNFGNASSIYSIGRKSKRAVEDARDKVANAIGAGPKEIYFTSCGSESDNLAIKGVAYANRERGNHIITTKIEHPAVLHTCQNLEKQGFNVTYLNVDSEGLISLKELEEAITDKTILISVMFANNEIGTIEPIKEIGEIAKKHNIYFHTDAVQAIGNVRINVNELNIDLLSMSAHKFYGPKGMGALYVRTGVKFDKIQDGGHQERNKRAGTENVAGIVGMGKAIELAYENFDEYNKKLTNLRDYYISQVEEKIPYIKLNGHRTKRLPGNANISFRFIEGESLLLNLDMKGICASSGSACTSGSLDPSHVLLAIGLPHEIAHGSLRITIGEENTKEDIDFLVNTLIEVVERLRNMSPLYEDFIKNR